MQSHMAAYKSVMEHLDKPLAGTIIRIPLRTPGQAIRSEISDRATTALEVAEVLKIFASEFGDCGLLFMRNLEKLELGDTTSPFALSVEMRGDGLRL
jgi:sacsin